MQDQFREGVKYGQLTTCTSTREVFLSLRGGRERVCWSKKSGWELTRSNRNQEPHSLLKLGCIGD